MKNFGILTLLGCLLLQLILAYTPVFHQSSSVPEALQTQQPVPNNVPAEAQVTAPLATYPAVPVMQAPLSSPYETVATQSSAIPRIDKKLPFPFSWFYNEEPVKPIIKHTVEVVQVPLVQFMNFHRNKIVHKPFIEIQQSVPLYANDKENSMIHFKMEKDRHASKIQVTEARLTIKRTGTGEDYGMMCPGKSIQISRPASSGIEAGVPPKTIGNTVSVDSSTEEVVADLMSIFREAGESIDPSDFWLMLEAGPQCYYTLSGNAEDVKATLTLSKEIKIMPVKPVKEKTSRMFIAPFIAFGVIGSAGLVYMLRKNRTDYTYFQDQGEYAAGP